MQTAEDGVAASDKKNPILQEYPQMAWHDSKGCDVCLYKWSLTSDNWRDLKDFCVPCLTVIQSRIMQLQYFTTVLNERRVRTVTMISVPTNMLQL